MDDLGDKINSILSDPGAFDKIASMAKSIMGGGEETSAAPGKPKEGGDMGIDPAMLARLGAIMNRSGSDKQALLTAMKPYLSEKRQKKMDKALKLAKLAAFAEIAAAEFGEERDV